MMADNITVEGKGIINPTVETVKTDKWNKTDTVGLINSGLGVFSSFFGKAPQTTNNYAAPKSNSNTIVFIVVIAVLLSGVGYFAMRK